MRGVKHAIESIILSSPLKKGIARKTSQITTNSHHHLSVHIWIKFLTAFTNSSLPLFFFLSLDLGGFNTDIMAKSKAKVVAVHLEGVNPFGLEQIQVMQEAVDNARLEGTRVRAFVLSNPHNPLGR
jgi:hypothetical protein